jgi:hypothetical protein
VTNSFSKGRASTPRRRDFSICPRACVAGRASDDCNPPPDGLKRVMTSATWRAPVGPGSESYFRSSRSRHRTPRVTRFATNAFGRRSAGQRTHCPRCTRESGAPRSGCRCQTDSVGASRHMRNSPSRSTTAALVSASERARTRSRTLAADRCPGTESVRRRAAVPRRAARCAHGRRPRS